MSALTHMPTGPTPLAARRAVAAAFFVNGFLVGSWAPQIPQLMQRLALTETVLGILILAFGLGAVIAMPLAGMAMARRGSRVVMRLCGFLACIALPVVVVAPGIVPAAVMLVAFGALLGGMDVAMNANAVAVEKRLGRAIMSSSHGFWSLGGFAGGGIGSFAIASYGAVPHAMAAALAAFVVWAIAARFVAGGDRQEPGADGHRFSLPRQPAIYFVGLIALCAMIPEGAILDWAAVYLQQERGAGIATAGLAFAAFSATMAVMRFTGDHIRNRLGAVMTLRISGLVAAVGLLVAGLAPMPELAIAAFAFTGLGIANMVPIAFSAAGNQPGLSAATGMATATTMGYSGILLAPSIIGFIAERTGFSAIFIALSAFLVGTFFLARLVRSADFTGH